MDKKIEELISLPDADQICAFLAAQPERPAHSLAVLSHKLADWLAKNDTRRALIEAMLPVFVDAMRWGENTERALDAQLLEALGDSVVLAGGELDDETLKALGVLT